MKTVAGSENDKTVIEQLKVENTELTAKVKEEQSSNQARLTELETKYTSVVIAETPEPDVAAVAAPTMEVNS